MLRIANREEMVRKVRAGHLTDGRHAPCIFSFPPCIPPRGNSRPPAPQNKVCRDRARAFLCPMDRHRLCFSSRGVLFPPTSQTATPGRARATPAPDGSVMSLAAVRKCRAGLPGCHVLCTFLLFPSPAGRRQPGMGHASPARLAPHPRSRNLRGWWRRCSRRGRAEASLLTGFVHRRHVG